MAPEIKTTTITTTNLLASLANHLKGASILFYTAFLGVSKLGRRVPSQPHFQNGYWLLFKFKASCEVDNEKRIIFKFNL